MHNDAFKTYMEKKEIDARRTVGTIAIATNAMGAFVDSRLAAREKRSFLCE